MKLLFVAWAATLLLAASSLCVPLHDAPSANVLSSSTAPLPLSWRVFSWLFTDHPLLEPRLVQTCETCQPYWTTELGKQLLFVRGIRYVDLSAAHASDPHTSHQWTSFVAAQSANKTHFPRSVEYKEQLSKHVFHNISDTGPRKHLAKFTSFRTRYYRSSSGRDSQLWLLQTVKDLAATRKDLSIEVNEFSHSWGQNSIILHIPTAHAENDASQGTTIVGAHQDSTNLIPLLAAPGADDDGSGTVTLLEALRVLLATPHWKPKTPVEFHWYSAEEGGLLGSQDVVRAYKDRGANIKAMLQQDMTAFVKKGTKERVGLPIDFVDTDLRDFVKLLVSEYLHIPSVDTKLGWAASDHASWLKAGYPSAFAIEAPFEDCNMQRIQ